MGLSEGGGSEGVCRMNTRGRHVQTGVSGVLTPGEGRGRKTAGLDREGKLIRWVRK